MRKKEIIIEILTAIITAYRSFSFIEGMVNACDLSLSVFKWDSIAYLMGIDLSVGFEKEDGINDKYANIFEDIACDSDISVNDAAHLLYSKYQDEISKDLKDYPFLSVDYQEKKAKKAA